ncbi:MAG TPA: hypothetical protein VFM01_10835 [Nakamurella sp.]|nr:hypothetical protein [Nakamurella sp.]
MIPAFGGWRLWPLNSEIAVLRADPQAVRRQLDPRGRGVVAEYPDLDTAIAANAPYPFGRRDTEFLVAAPDGATVTLSSAAPRAGLLHLFRADAARMGWESVAAQWTPRQPGQLAAAGFDHFRPSAADLAGPGPGPRATDQLTVQVADTGRRWVFDRIPPGAGHPDRDYEVPETYRARRAADRLPLTLIRRYLLAAGIPVDDPGYLRGRVITLTQPRRMTGQVEWSDMAGLRAAAGYPADGMPTDLTADPATGPRESIGG